MTKLHWNQDKALLLISADGARMCACYNLKKERIKISTIFIRLYLGRGQNQNS